MKYQRSNTSNELQRKRTESKHLSTQRARRQVEESGPSVHVAGRQSAVLPPTTSTDGPLSVTRRLACRPVVF